MSISNLNTSKIKSPSLPLMESFYTIQGEGQHQGRAAYFIRLGGCDIGCPWCDVKDSWDMGKHPLITIETMVYKAAESGTEIAVITGGEPLMHNLTELTNALHSRNIQTHIETSGAYPITGKWDWICLSPKKFKPALEENLKVARELKVIVFNKSDFKWAEEHSKKVNSDCKLFLQPEWSNREKMLPLIIDYVKQYPEWMISLQIHKFLNIP